MHSAPTTSSLRIRLKRHPDGSASLTCTRPDGTTTWQRQAAALAMVFVPHDLTHFAVESVLRYRHAFYGLIAEGWDIQDFVAPFPRGAPPREALEVELLVGCFDTERRNFIQWTAAELNAHAQMKASTVEGAKRVLPRLITGDELSAIRRELRSVLDQWNAVSPGETLELARRLD